MAYRTLIDTATLAKNLDDSDWRVFDLRHDLMNPDVGRQQYAEGHIAGAMFVNLDSALSGEKTGANGRHPLPDAGDFQATLGEWGVKPAQQIVVYDASGGVYAGRLWWMLRWMGHYSVAVLDGGFTKWEKEGRPVTAEVPHFAPTMYRGAPRTMHVDAVFVEANLGKPEVTVIDARTAGRFAGVGETIDPVGGHIPGALNRPFGQNIGANGKFKSPAELNAEFTLLLAGRDPATVVHHCGSGVSAVPNIIAMEVAGLGRQALYAGSWSDWSSDPERPFAQG